MREEERLLLHQDDGDDQPAFGVGGGSRERGGGEQHIAAGIALEREGRIQISPFYFVTPSTFLEHGLDYDLLGDRIKTYLLCCWWVNPSTPGKKKEKGRNEVEGGREVDTLSGGGGGGRGGGRGGGGGGRG